MPIFLKSKIVFIHIPKTGGSSFSQVFSERGDSSLFKGGFLNGHSSQHTTFRELKELNLIPEDFRIVSIIRNPYERFVSEYNYRGKKEPIQDFANRLFYGLGDWDNHNLSCSTFLEGCEPELIRFENFESDFKKVTGFEMNIHAHKSQPFITVDDLSWGVIEQINYWWEEDFKYFGYYDQSK